jgi:hypothetical protein
MAEMSFEEKGVWVTTGIFISSFVIYVVIILNRAADVPVTEVAYVRTMIWMVGISIAASILGMIGVGISAPEDADKKDERDKSINRYGERINGSVLGFLMILPLGLAMAEADHFWIANAMYLAGVVSALVGATAKILAYRRGF